MRAPADELVKGILADVLAQANRDQNLAFYCASSRVTLQ